METEVIKQESATPKAVAMEEHFRAAYVLSAI